MNARGIALGLLLAGASGGIAWAEPPATVASHGGVTVVRQNDPHSQLLGTVLIVRAGLDRQTLRQNGLAAFTAQTILQTPVTVRGSATMVPLEAAIAASGGSISFTVDPDGVRFYVESLAADAPAVLGMFEQALRAPDFGPATVREARTALARTVAADAQRSQYPLQVGIEMLDAVSASQANLGLPALGTPASLAQLVPADVAQFYKTYYRSGGSVVSVAGKLDAVDPALLSGLGDVLPSGTTSAVSVPPLPGLHGSSREIVAHRDVAAPWLIARYPAPSLDSRDFGPMLVLSAFMQRTLSELAQVPGTISPTVTSRAVGAEYFFDRSAPHLVLYVNGSIGNPTRAFATALSVVGMLSETKLQGAIDDFKAAAAGDFATNATTLATRAWLAATFARDGASPDYLARAMQAISATTPQDVQRVARKYLGAPTIALVLPRDESPQN